jgi:hypothetical protein
VSKETVREVATTREMGKTPLNVVRAGWRDPANAPRTVTLGWEPGCACPARDPVPCVVLDPFCGSGTTGVVARRFGRSFVGTDLNPSYLAMARKRIAETDVPLPLGPVDPLTTPLLTDPVQTTMEF